MANTLPTLHQMGKLKEFSLKFEMRQECSFSLLLLSVVLKGFIEAKWQCDVNWKRSLVSSFSDCIILYLKDLKDSTRKYSGPIINVNKQMFKKTDCPCVKKWNQSYTSDAANKDKNFHIIQKTILRINKWDYIKSKTFCTVKGHNCQRDDVFGSGMQMPSTCQIGH